MAFNTFDRFRSEFPHLVQDRVYFDHAAVSPMSNRVRQCLNEFADETQSGVINNYLQCHERKQLVRKQVSELVNCDPDRIAFVKSTTDGLILLARGYPWKRGDRILLHKEEFPSNVYPWWELKQNGVELDFMEQPLGCITTDDLEKHITPETRLVAVSWVQYLSGCRNDVKALADWCHARNILLAVDGMQGLGALKFDVEDSGIDFLSTGTAKWLMGPHGIGFIYISEKLQDRIHPPHLGWLSRQNVMDFHNYDQPLRPSASRYEFATETNIGIYGLNGSLGLLLEATPEAIEKQIKNLSDYLITGLDALGFHIYSPRENMKWSGIVTIDSGSDPKNEEIYQALARKNVTVSFRGNLLRIAPHFYNNSDDIDQFLDRLGNNSTA